MDFIKLQSILKEIGEPAFRYRQIKDAFTKQFVLDFKNISTISKSLAEDLAEKISPLSFKAEKILESKDGLSFKALLRLSDGAVIETVLLSPLPGRWSACLSSQVGCSLACRFCATGQGGFRRNLTSEEITDQVLFWKNFFKEKKLAGKFSSLVFMGMGEPFLNWPEVKSALKILIDKEFFNLGSRSISVSTSGIPDGIKNMAREFPQINLAVSLIFPNDRQRSQYMPVNRRFNLNQLKKALTYYFSKTNRKVFFEYVMFKGLNDQAAQADELIEFIKSIEGGAKLIHVNLIRYNAASGGFSPSDAKTTEWFKDYLKWFKDYLNKNKVGATIRKSLGEEIKGACGQLAGNQ
ncbi:MAG: 23S rRNA (adenine(2503)-C(2))-methyltransferase RlmN [Patescibacteria group bacterium]|nr:23S rRNA (adenine(2503)-C(2))-methyltransferase RlmN [Patescibacteria group bacterium]MDD5294483.1 23S rRNA (adenine(2503)-C(2))-methyltransferase RlmN [Patescibacteria group bacterium]MDD5554401.1 23S rRNA (adenine(2503)-C(2))-methyltransferase RlmN [Patescibacteria group bacterium]